MDLPQTRNYCKFCVVCRAKKCMESQGPEQGSPKKGAGYRDYVTSRLFSFSSKAISSLSENGVKVLYSLTQTHIFSVESCPRTNLLEQLLDQGGLAHFIVAADDDLHPGSVSKINGFQWSTKPIQNEGLF